MYIIHDVTLTSEQATRREFLYYSAFILSRKALVSPLQLL